MENKNQQELMLKLSMFEQQIRQLQEQLQAVEQGIVELTSLNFGLDELKDATGKEVLSPIGRGIFVKTKLVSKELTVDVGGKIFVKKSVSETKKVIENQIKKLNEIKGDLDKNLEKINQELRKSIMDAQEK